MLQRAVYGSLLYFFLSMTTAASAPSVAVDIAPVHSLLSKVMEGVATPNLIVQPGASPHSYSLSPSEAEALQQAELVFWISEKLSPWLEKPLANLAGSAKKVELLELPGTTTHEFRKGATFDAHEHHADEHDEDHAAKEEEHHPTDHEEEHHDEHHHDGLDPHAWLDPENAKIWMLAMAEELSVIDVANAEVYRRNTESAVAELDALIEDIREQTMRLHDIKFIVFHDAYQYFEQRFGVYTSGAISLGDASDPSPARVKEIQDTVNQHAITCVFTEPQYNPELVRSVFGDTTVTTIGVMDPLGADIEPGAALYSTLLRNLVVSLEQCKK